MNLLVIFTIKYLSTLCVSWKYMNKLRWQRKVSALLDWFPLSGIGLVAFCSLLKSRLKSVQRRRRRSLQQPITVGYASRAPPVPTHPVVCVSSLSHMKEVCVPSHSRLVISVLFTVDINQRAVRRKLNSFGHVCRMNNERLIKTVVFWVTEGPNKPTRTTDTEGNGRTMWKNGVMRIFTAPLHQRIG